MVKNEFTPGWFFEKWGCNCPRLTPEQMESFKNQQVGSEMGQSWKDEVYDVNKKYHNSPKKNNRKKMVW